MRFLIIGGSDAGISAALRVQELSPSWEITLILADDFPNYSICGLPFYLSGETPDWRSLAHRTEFPGIEILAHHKAETINATHKSVEVRRPDGSGSTLAYDKLLIATGARPVQPAIEGLGLPGVFLLHTMEDSFAVHRYLQERQPQSAVIVGAGYIGLEMADALAHRGLHVCVAGRSERVLATVDPSLGARLESQMRQHGVEIRNGIEVTSITPSGPQLAVTGSPDFIVASDLVLVAVGVQPNAELGVAAGIPTGAKGALQVSRCMETVLPDVYAAGDCAVTWHRLLQSNTYRPLGTTAHKQGRTAGQNAVGLTREFAGSLGTQVVKVFDLVAARTGLREREARDAGYDPFTTEVTVWDHKAYYPGAHEMQVRITGERGTGKLLGAQLLGSKHSEIAKRVDIFATALFHGMTIEALNNLDLSYTPPLSSPWDPVQMGAQEWNRALARQLDQPLLSLGKK